MTRPPRKKRPPIDEAYADWQTSDEDAPPADLRQPDPNDFQALGSNPRRSQLVSYEDPCVDVGDGTSGPLISAEGGHVTQRDQRARRWDRAKPADVSWTRKPPAEGKTKADFLLHEQKVERERREYAQWRREKVEQDIADAALRRSLPASPNAIRYAPGGAELIRYDPNADELNLHTAWTWDLDEDERALRRVGTRPVRARPRPLDEEPPAVWEDEVPDDAWSDTTDLDDLLAALVESERLEAACEHCHANPKATGLPYCAECCCGNQNHRPDDMRPVKSTFWKFKNTPAYGVRLCSACLAYASGRDHRGKLRPRRLLGGRKR